MSRTLTQTARPMFGTSAVRGAQTSIADRAFDGVFGTLALWSARIQQRQSLSDMDSRMLEDIGVSGREAVVESYKPFWFA